MTSRNAQMYLNCFHGWRVPDIRKAVHRYHEMKSDDGFILTTYNSKLTTKSLQLADYCAGNLLGCEAAFFLEG